MTDRHGHFSPLEREELRNEQLEHDNNRLRQEILALRALVKEAFCEGMMSAEGASRPLNSDMESAWKHSESRELMERF